MSESEPAGVEQPWNDRYVTKNQAREAVVDHLRDDEPARPSEIAREQDLEPSAVSAALSQLRDRGHVELLGDSTVYRGRMYVLSGSDLLDRDVDWVEFGYVVSSKYRVACLELLEDRDRTPTQLAEASGYLVTHISRALRQLRERGLVVLRVPETQQKDRYYGLTSAGEELVPALKERDDR